MRGFLFPRRTTRRRRRHCNEVMLPVLMCILWLLLVETSRSVTAHQDTSETKDPPNWLECRPRQGDTTIVSTHNSKEEKDIDLECVFRITASYKDIENVDFQQQTHCSGEFCVTAHVWRADPKTIPSKTKESADVVESNRDESTPQNSDLTNTYHATATNNNGEDVDPILGPQQQSTKYVDNSYDDDVDNEADDYDDDYYDDDYYDDENETNNEHDGVYQEPIKVTSIAVGTMRYDAPWIQYGEDTEEQLLKLQELLWNPINSGTYERAILYDTIGLCHLYNLPYSDGSQYVWEFYRAANAWREASRLLDELYQRDADGVVGKLLADVQNSLADLFLLHFDTDIPGMDHDPILPQKKRRHYFLIIEDHISRALQLFSLLRIDQLYKDGDNRSRIELSYASTYIRMSELILLRSEFQKSANSKIEMERMRDHAQRGVDLVQSQSEESRQLRVNFILDVGLLGLSILGTAHSRLENTQAAIEAWEDCVSLYKTYHKRASPDEDHVTTLAHSYENLADNYLQTRSFAKAKESYRAAMETYQSLNLFNDFNNDFTELEDIQIRQYKKQFQQLETPTDDNLGLGGDEDNNESLNGLLDLAHLHGSLGSVKMSVNKMELAAFHFNKAIELYKQCAGLYGSDILTNILMADYFYMLSDIHQIMGKYKDSADAFDKALDLYRDNIADHISHLQWNGEKSQPRFLLRQKDNKKPQVTKNIKPDAITHAQEGEEDNGNARLMHVVNLVDYEQAILNATKADSL